MKPLLGCIADDVTGATDLASTLVKNGMRTVQLIGVPRDAAPPDCDAIVIAQKTRTIPAADAVAASLSALRWLREAGCRQYFFKYCSTFDSTDRGNIGPVAEALMDELRCDFTIACPAFPANGRAVFRGYLFVGDVLLHESGMQNHPLTPMRDSNLVRVLQRQSRGSVGLIPHDVVKQGAARIQQAFAAAQTRMAIVDAIDDDDLNAIGAACRELPLLTGGSGVAMGLPAMYRAEGWLSAATQASRLPRVEGGSAVISGSCSLATQRQVAAMREHAPSFFIDPLRGADVAHEAIDWAAKHIAQGPVLVYATADVEAVKTVQKELGVEKAGAMIESTLAAVARGLRELGVTRFIVAGGETSGAVAAALGVTGLRIGAEIDPGVPWTVTLDEKPLALALKSGNFGSPDFFLKAWKQLP